MKKLLVTTGALAAVLLGCGSVTAVPADASAEGAASSSDAGADAGDRADDAAFADVPDRTAPDDASWPTDAACNDAALTGDSGAPFACGNATCASGAEYCGHFAAGFSPLFEPQRGCQPLPCTCVPARSCGCLGQLPDYCRCQADNGAISVTCSLP